MSEQNQHQNIDDFRTDSDSDSGFVLSEDFVQPELTVGTLVAHLTSEDEATRIAACDELEKHSPGFRKWYESQTPLDRNQ